MTPKFQAMLIGGAVAAVLSSSYLSIINCLCCAGIITGAIVSVWYYTDRENVTIAAGEGATLGIGAAVIGALLAAILDIPLTAVGIGTSEILTEALNTIVEMMPADQADDFRDQMEDQRGLGAGMRILSLIISILISAIFGAIGGVIGASLFKKGAA